MPRESPRSSFAPQLTNDAVVLVMPDGVKATPPNTERTIMRRQITLDTSFDRAGEKTTLIEVIRYLIANGCISDIDPADAHTIPDLVDDFITATTTTGMPTVHQVLAAYYVAATTELALHHLNGAVNDTRFHAGMDFINRTVFDLEETP